MRKANRLLSKQGRSALVKVKGLEWLMPVVHDGDGTQFRYRVIRDSQPGSVF